MATEKTKTLREIKPGPTINRDGSTFKRDDPKYMSPSQRYRHAKGQEKTKGRWRLRRMTRHHLGWRLKNEAIPTDDWSWSSTQVPAPKKQSKNRKRNKFARKSRKVNC